jgi:hypothetical protein
MLNAGVLLPTMRPATPKCCLQTHLLAGKAGSSRLSAHLLAQHCNVRRPEAVRPSSTLTQQVQHQRLRQAAATDATDAVHNM